MPVDVHQRQAASKVAKVQVRPYNKNLKSGKFPMTGSPTLRSLTHAKKLPWVSSKMNPQSRRQTQKISKRPSRRAGFFLLFNDAHRPIQNRETLPIQQPAPPGPGPLIANYEDWRASTPTSTTRPPIRETLQLPNPSYSFFCPISRVCQRQHDRRRFSDPAILGQGSLML